MSRCSMSFQYTCLPISYCILFLCGYSMLNVAVFDSRIFMSGADSINPLPDVTKNTWFVEDITLATTTLRYARTNEVCTVNNWSISSTRIVNLARSANATVHFEFKAHISILDSSKLEDFRREIHQYVEERPRVWSGVVHIRHSIN